MKYFYTLLICFFPEKSFWRTLPNSSSDQDWKQYSMWYRPLSKYQSWCYVMLCSHQNTLNLQGRLDSSDLSETVGSSCRSKRPWENMSLRAKSVFLEPFSPRDLGESYQHQFRVTIRMGLAKGCPSCPAEISLGNKTPRESSSCLFFSAVSLVLPCSKIRSPMPIKTMLKLATPVLCLFQNWEIFQHSQLHYSTQGHSCPSYRSLHFPWSHPTLRCTCV